MVLKKKITDNTILLRKILKNLPVAAELSRPNRIAKDIVLEIRDDKKKIDEIRVIMGIKNNAALEAALIRWLEESNKNGGDYACFKLIRVKNPKKSDAKKKSKKVEK